MRVSAKHRQIVQLILVSLVTCTAIVHIAENHEEPESRWEPVIQRFEAADQANPPPKGAILFAGSSSIVYWQSLAEDMAPLTVINRGFGGSQMFELNMFRDRIVTPYAPRAVLTYEGDNDVAAGKEPTDILAEYRDFVDHLKQHLPDTNIYFIAVKPSIRRAHLWPTMVEVNNGLQALADEHDHVQFLDTSTPMLGEDGTVMTDLLVEDGLHMNANGYAIWTDVIRPVLMSAYGK